MPANTTATLYLPAVSEKNISENGKPAGKSRGVTFVRMENGNAIYEIGSGSYLFVVKR